MNIINRIARHYIKQNDFSIKNWINKPVSDANKVQILKDNEQAVQS